MYDCSLSERVHSVLVNCFAKVGLYIFSDLLLQNFRRLQPSQPVWLHRLQQPVGLLAVAIMFRKRKEVGLVGKTIRVRGAMLCGCLP